MFQSGSEILDRRVFQKGSPIIWQGDKGDCAYFIQTGLVKIFVEQDGREIELARMGNGEIFGEIALVTDEPRTASVRALETTNVIVVSRSTFNDKLEECDPAITSIIHMLMKRIMAANHALVNRPENISELIEVVYKLYQGVHVSLPEEVRSDFEKEILPPLKAYLETVRGFIETHQIETINKTQTQTSTDGELD